MDRILLGSRIKQARNERDVTLDELASAVGLNKSTISRYERGEIESPKLPVIEAIGSNLHVNPSWLIGQSNDKTYTPPMSGAAVYIPYNLFTPLKTLRAAKGLSAEEAAYRIGLSVNDYSAIERGGNTDCVTLARIANFFCCSTDFILAFDGVSNEDDQVAFVKGKLFRLHKAFGQLTSEQQEQVIAFADNLGLEEASRHNTLQIAARDGRYQEINLTDEQLHFLLHTLDQLPDVSEGL